MDYGTIFILVKLNWQHTVHTLIGQKIDVTTGQVTQVICSVSCVCAPPGGRRR